MSETTGGQGRGGGGTTRSCSLAIAGLAVFLCIEFAMRLFVRGKSFCCLLWDSQGKVESKSPL